jgi:hypothetical protein
MPIHRVLRPASCVFLLATLASVTAAAEGYDPSAHPAQVVRRMTAYTEPIRTLDLAPEPGGRIADITVDVGHAIPADGGPVVRLDAVFADLAVAQAEAAHAAATAAVHARRLDAERHRAELDFAEREFKRFDSLATDGRASEQTRDARGLDRERARIAVAGDASAIAAAEADLAAAEARSGDARERRARHDMVAPAGWIVTERLREIGALVAPGEPVLRLADVGTLVLAFRLDEPEVAAVRRLHTNGALSLRFAQAEAVPASLRRVDVTFDAVSRKRLVELTVAGEALREASGGLSAELELTVDDPGAVTIPIHLVQWRFERAILKDQDGREHVVSPLRRTDTTVIIAPSALPAGIRLVPHD